MTAYLARRVIIAFVTIWLISIVSFIIITLPPGDYITHYVERLAMSADQVDVAEAEHLRTLYGLEQPAYVQYGKWMWRLVRGDAGFSMDWQLPVRMLIIDRLGATMALTAMTIAITWALAMPIGIYSAIRQRSAFDYAFTFVGFVGLAVPDFLLALLLMYLAWVHMGLSIGGLFSIEYESAPWSLGKVWDLITHLWIPAIVLGTSGTAGLIRIMRANLLDELHKPYVVTARAKGLRELKLIIKYPVRVALNPFISGIGYLLPALVGGSVIVSIVMSLPTLGPLLLRALLFQDMFMAGTIVFMLGILTVFGTLISDILLMVVDPRIRMEGR